jgi:hypothetical protein
MRVIEVEDEGRSDRWLWWTLAGVAVGVTAGVLVAEKFSGRRPSARGIWHRARGFAKTASGQWMPLLELALELREMWNERGEERDEADDDLGEELDAEIAGEIEDADEYEEAEPPADLDDELDDSEIGLRVLEAFTHDPILAERFVEIEADDDGDVILHGRVRAAREVAHAVTIARGVPGVTRVRQRLEVRSRR